MEITSMATDDEKVDALRDMFHALDVKVERILALMSERSKRDDETETRLKTVENQCADNTNAIRVIKWVGSAAFGVVMIATAYLVQLGIDTLRQLVGLLHK